MIVLASFIHLAILSVSGSQLEAVVFPSRGGLAPLQNDFGCHYLEGGCL